MDYLFDDTFEGVLSGIYRMFHDKLPLEDQRLIPKSKHQYTFFQEAVEVVTHEEHAAKVSRSILETFGEEAFKQIGYAFLSEDESYGTKLYRCLKKAYKMGGRAFENLSDPDISEFYRLYRAVVRESHRMIGLLRFVELEKAIFYAQFEPTYDLLGLIVPHFVDRLGDQLWVIHDTKRRKAAFYNGTEVHFSDLDPVETLYCSSREWTYQQMWRAYFEHIAIDERKNPKLQRQMMPKKYWKYLIEKNPSKNLLN